MNVIINTKVKIPSEQETKVKILSIAQQYGCFAETKKLYEKYEYMFKQNKYDYKANYDMAKSLIQELSNINIALVIWLADEQGNIRVNNNIVFTVVDVPTNN